MKREERREVIIINLKYRRVSIFHFSLFIFLFSFALSCGSNVNSPIGLPGAQSPFAGFRDIPGITAEEIAAIEDLRQAALQKQNPCFVFGATLSTESFLKEEGGEVGGFIARYCDWLTSLFDIKFEPRIYVLSDMIEKLTTTELDFGILRDSEERRKTYFLTDAIAERMIIMLRLVNSENLERISTPRYAFLEGSTTYDMVREALEPGTYEAVFAADYDTGYAMLKNEEADAFVEANIARAAFEQHIDVYSLDFMPLLFNPVNMLTANPDFQPIISVITKAQRNGAMPWLIHLYNEGNLDYTKYKVSAQLNDVEREYIANHPVVHYAAETSNYPVSFYNFREKQWQGIAIDVLGEVELLTGLRFERVNDENAVWADLLGRLEDGRASLITELFRTSEREGRFLWSDVTLMIDSTALISGDDFPNIHLNEIMYIRIGLIKDYAHTDLFRRWFPNHPNTVEYGSTLLAIEGLERGEVDMVMTSNHELLIMSNYLERAGYKSNFVFNNILRVAFGYNINEAVLLSIIDKALHLIDTETISNRWLRQTYDYRAKVAEAQRPWLIGATVLSLALLAAILFMFIGVLGARKRLTKLVAEKTSTLTAILDTTPDLIFCKDLNSLTTECNKASEMYFNTPKEKIIGKPDPQTLNWTHEMQKQSIAADEKVMNERQVVVVEEYIQSSTGEQRLFETIKSPLIQEGKVVGLVGMARDITQRKAAEEEARSASEAKTRFIAAMSHELRTPMNSIIGFSELALNDQLPNETKDYLNKIMINSEWLLQIINDILDISKIESGKMDMERIPFDLHELFIACRTIILPKAGEKDITLYFYTEPSIGRKMLGDPLRLRQVLLNLLSNAVKFTGKGGIVKISANVKGFLNDKITIIFEVKDSGIGMTDEQIVKITQPFMQADTATTRKYGGTGLGLTISKNIIEILGGRLMVESTLGVGSKFSFDVTFDTVEYDENALEPGYGDTPADRPHFSGEVLICEDNLMNQQVLNEHLEKVGLKTDVAENGREGFNMVKRRQTKGLKPYDLIFMDINMPVMDGIEASTLIQALNTGTPIVAMTANVMTHDRELYRECGMKGCVGKPFRVQELWDCLLIYFTPEKWERKDEEENKEQNEKFRSSLIATFVKDNRNRYIEIVEALDCGDIKSANRLAHTMKSNAGQLGKTDLQKACADIEHLLKDGENLVTAEHLAVLETRLKAVIDEFTPLVKEPEPPPEVKSLDEQEAREILAQVKPLLERGSPDCLKYTDKLRGIPGSGEPLVRILIQQMEDLDFDLALKTLGEVMKSEE